VLPFAGLRGNAHGLSMARWKTRVDYLLVTDNWTFFASSHCWGTISGYWSISLCSKGRWVTFSANFSGNGASPTNDCWRQKTRVPYSLAGLSRGVVCVIRRFDTIPACDRQTDRHTMTRLRLIPALTSIARVKIWSLLLLTFCALYLSQYFVKLLTER